LDHFDERVCRQHQLYDADTVPPPVHRLVDTKNQTAAGADLLDLAQTFAERGADVGARVVPLAAARVAGAALPLHLGEGRSGN
jgi:hypothetical protein